VVIIEYDFASREALLLKISHGTPLLGKNVVFAEPLCKKGDCRWCDAVRYRILSRSSL